MKKKEIIAEINRNYNQTLDELKEEIKRLSQLKDENEKLKAENEQMKKGDYFTGTILTYDEITNLNNNAKKFKIMYEMESKENKRLNELCSELKYRYEVAYHNGWKDSNVNSKTRIK